MSTVIGQIVVTATAEVTRAPQNAHLDENNEPAESGEQEVTS